MFFYLRDAKGNLHPVNCTHQELVTFGRRVMDANREYGERTNVLLEPVYGLREAIAATA